MGHIFTYLRRESVEDMIVLDLEWSQPYGGGMEEILQIGAVRLEKMGAPLSGCFNVYIKPAKQKRLSPIARKLPDAKLSMTEGVPFCGGIYGVFGLVRGGDGVRRMGRQDNGVLEQNARLWGLPVLEMPEYVDLQASFNRTLGIGMGRRLALEHAAAYCGIPQVFEYHNALHDAMYAALVSGWIRPEAVAGPPREHTRRVRGRGLTALTYPEAAAAEDGVLQGAGGRAEQPDGAAGGVSHLPAPGRGELLVSPGEGAVLRHVLLRGSRAVSVRMAVVQRKDGQWQGRRTVPQVTEQEKAALRSAAERAGAMPEKTEK